MNGRLSHRRLNDPNTHYEPIFNHYLESKSPKRNTTWNIKRLCGCHAYPKLFTTISIPHYRCASRNTSTLLGLLSSLFFVQVESGKIPKQKPGRRG